MKWSYPPLQSLWLIAVLAAVGCRHSPSKPSIHNIVGKTMGTYYSIKYTAPLRPGLQHEIDSLLFQINDEVSTYIDSSVISIFNRSNTPLFLGHSESLKGRSIQHFLHNYYLADSLYKWTGGDFDPTIMPLVNYWGFGYEERLQRVDTLAPDSLMALVGMHKITLHGDTLSKQLPGIQLDFSAIAKGDAVDEIAEYLHSKGVQNFLVDIGGEVRASGLKSSDNPWTIGINTPKENSAVSDVSLVLPLRDASVATSGNYRNYYTTNGRKYSHTINPRTGTPERNNLLSASIKTTSCARADALATACMVKGMPEAYDFIQKTNGVEGCFIYSLPSGRDTLVLTAGFLPITHDH